MTEYGQTATSLFRRVNKMPVFLAQATLPDGTYAMLGDTEKEKAHIIKGTPAEFAATQGKSGPKPSSRYSVYTTAGFAFARTGWGEVRPFADETMLSIRFGVPRQIHGHDDGSSITLYGYGTPLLLDSGKYTYNNNDYKTYFQGRKAHNLVTVDDAKFDPNAFTKHLWTRVSPTMFELATESNPYIGVTDTRRVTLSQKLGYVVVDDRLDSGVIHSTYRQLWHLKEKSDPVVSGSRTWTQQANGNILIVQLIAPDATNVINGATSPIQGWLSYEYNKKVAAPVVEAQINGSYAKFLTLLVPYATTQPIVKVTNLEITSSGYAMTVNIDGRSESLLMSATGSKITSLN
jgi:hypothetical protein